MHGAGVRAADGEGSNGPDEAGHRAGPCSRRGAFHPVLDGFLVAGKRRIEQHDLAPGLTGLSLEIIEAADYQHLSGNAGPRRRLRFHPTRASPAVSCAA